MSKIQKPRIGIIGLGQRGFDLLRVVFVPMAQHDIIEITACCDFYEDRAEKGAAYTEEQLGKRPFTTTNWKEVVDHPEVDAVLVLTAWESHVDMCIYSMRAGKKVGVEVGCTYNIEDCYRLVRAYEETGIHCMMLENCCYGRRELMALNMVREGIFGSVVHCSGGYMHDLRDEIVNGDVNRHYRQRNYLLRNCENYPTHELGPIMQILDINNGNRFVTLNSVSSCAKGLHEYAVEHRGADDPVSKLNFAQGDIVTTVLKCADGRTVVLTLDTTLPRSYSRGLTVRGTKALYTMDGDYIFFDGNNHEATVKDLVNNPENAAEDLSAKYEHRIWKEYRENPIGGHEGIDWLAYNAFVESIREDITPPIDTYDTATLMCISTLSEQSIAMGGAPVAVPDFTSGRWITRTEIQEEAKGYYTLKK
ncbi:MAG: Gfo/Idh/MocA family oxidoreductase [Ruminococcaceae bacterium]|nr:Gfo/Idh/MocA family oxidoreductase [Oscillospiraceae bacterium]